MADNAGSVKADVVIVGGGLAGLTTAVGLAGSGLSTIVLEKDGILGGRARSWIDPSTGDSITVGPHIFLSEYPNMRKLLRGLGTENRVVWQRGKFITIMDGRKETVIRMRRLPPPFNYVPCILKERDFFPYRDINSNRKAASFCISLSEADVMELDRTNALSALRRLGVTEDFIQRFWAFTALAIMNVPLDRCSAGSLFRFFKLMSSNTYYDVGFADTGLGDLFVPQAKAAIERAGGRVVTGTEVRRLTGENGKATGVKLKDGTQISARWVVAAVPPTQMGRLLPDHWRREVRPFSSLSWFAESPYISTYLWFDRKLTNRQFWARSFLPEDMNCDFYDYSNIYRERSTQNSLITTNCIYSERMGNMTDEEVIEATLRELAENIPRASSARVVHHRVVRIPMAIHCPYPGVERRRPGVETGVENLFVAGDWVQTEVPASMESAACAGFMTAERILAAAGQPKKLALRRKSSEGISALVEHLAPRLRKMGYLPRIRDVVGG